MLKPQTQAKPRIRGPVGKLGQASWQEIAASSGHSSLDSYRPQTHSSVNRVINYAGTTTSGNAFLRAYGADLRARSHQAIAEDNIARGVVSNLVTSVIGEGITPICLSENVAFRQQFDEVFSQFCDECDYSGQMDFKSMQAQVFRAQLASGDSFVRLRTARDTGQALLQPIEGEMCPYSMPEMETREIVREGIGFRQTSRLPVSYYFHREHPGDGLANLAVNELRKYVRVPAAFVLHVFEQMRPGDRRGAPVLQPALKNIADLKHYIERDIKRKEMSGLLMAKERRGVGENVSFASQFGFGGSSTEREYDNTIEDGAIIDLPHGHDFDLLDPPKTDTELKQFMTLIYRQIAQGTGLIAQMVSGDYSDTNYSSIRAALLQHYRFVGLVQKRLAKQFINPAIQWMVDRALADGRLTPPDETHLRWRLGMPAIEAIDPAKTALANKLDLSMQLISRDDLIRARGLDPHGVRQSIQNEQDDMRARGIFFDSTSIPPDETIREAASDD